MTLRLFVNSTVLALLGSAVLLAGCSSTPRGLAHKTARPVADAPLIQQSLEVQSFAKAVSALAVGEKAIFAMTPLGNDLTVTGQPFYDNALGERCRTAKAQLGQSMQIFAVCEQSDGSWRYVAPLTDSTGSY